MTAALLARCLPVRRLNYPLRSRLTSNQHQYQYHYQGGVFAVGAVVGSMVECWSGGAALVGDSVGVLVGVLQVCCWVLCTVSRVS